MAGACHGEGLASASNNDYVRLRVARCTNKRIGTLYPDNCPVLQSRDAVEQPSGPAYGLKACGLNIGGIRTISPSINSTRSSPVKMPSTPINWYSSAVYL